MTTHDIERLATARLIGQRIQESDTEEMVRLHLDPDVMATLGGIRSREETAGFIQTYLDHWEKYGHGVWMFHHREDNAFVCRGTLGYARVEDDIEIELGYAVRAEYWRRGYATEISKAILNAAFDRVGLKNVVAFTMTTNTGSRGVIEKMGMQYEKEFVRAELPHVLYRITQEQWQAQQ